MEQMKLPFNITEIAQFSVGDMVRLKDSYIDDIYNDYFANDDWCDEDDEYDECARDDHLNYLEGVFEIVEVRQILKFDRVTHLRYEYHVDSDYDMWFYDREIERED